MKKKLLLACLFTATSFMANSQYHVKQYFMTSGGSFSQEGNRVKPIVIKDGGMFALDSVLGDFSNFVHISYDRINSRYVGYAHVGRQSGKDVIVQYDLDSYQRIDSILVSGAQAMTISRNKIFVAKGFGAIGSNLDIFNSTNGNLITGVEGIYPASDVKLFGDSVYVAHSSKSVVDMCPGLFECYGDSLGFISVINIHTNAIAKTIELGKTGAGLKNLQLYKGEDSKIHIFYNNTMDNGTIANGSFVLHAIANTTVVEAKGENIYGVRTTSPYLTAVKINKASGDTTLQQAYKKSVTFTNDAYGYDTVNNTYIILRTDFATFSKFIRYDTETEATIDSVTTDISATAFAIDYRPGLPTAIAANASHIYAQSVYPNPVKDQLRVKMTNSEFSDWTLLTAEGLMVGSGLLNHGETVIGAENLERGAYFLQLKGNSNSATVKIIKQ